MRKLILLLALVIFPAPQALALSDNCPSVIFPVTTTPQKIDLPIPLGQYKGVRCFNTSATPVFFGSETHIVYPYCTDLVACPDGAIISIPARSVWVKVAVGTGSVTCMILG